MVTFFIILAVLMVLVVAAGSWGRPRRRVLYDRDVVVDRRPRLLEEEVVDDPYDRPVMRRRVARRRRVY